MIRSGLKTRVILSFLCIIVMLGGLVALFGYWMIRTNIIDRAQNQVRCDLADARSVYYGEQEAMKRTFGMLDSVKDPEKVKTALGLDFLYTVGHRDRTMLKSQIAARAFLGKAASGTRIVDSAELAGLGRALYENACLLLKPIPQAVPAGVTSLHSALVIEAAAPIFAPGGAVTGVIYGGKLINRNSDLVSRIHHIVFEDRLYRGKQIGSVTIFQNDVRIATDVIDKSGRPALGTRVSAAVYKKVLLQGVPWNDRAWVVSTWYLTAYEPIRDPDGKIVGMLSVGALEAPFAHLIRSSLFWFGLILGGCTLLAFVLTLFLAGSIANPLTRLANAAGAIARGDLSHRVPNGNQVREIDELTAAFNEMADKLEKREASLHRANQDLATLNNRYLDLVGMVSHELKGILASTVLNACSVHDGYFGPLNEAQARAMAAVTRNLDYFDLTVKNYLNLSRIENNELALCIAECLLGEDVVDESAAAFSRQAQERSIRIENLVPRSMNIKADAGQLAIVLNNLIGNAIKYGSENGVVSISATPLVPGVVIEVFNTGRPLAESEQKQLFRRFFRLAGSPEVKRTRGTGLGLFICRQIVERHQGTIRCEARKDGNAFVIELPQEGAAS